METREITGELYGWFIAPSYYTDAWAITGYILNDAKGRFADHTMIRSSKIVEIDMENRLVHTLNSTYKLLYNHEIPEFES